MLNKEFTKEQRSLIKTIYSFKQPIVIVGKPESGKEQVMNLFKELDVNGVKIFLEGNNVFIKRPYDNHLDKVLLVDVVNTELAKMLGNYIRIDVFSKEEEPKVNLRISDITTGDFKHTISLPESTNTYLIVDELSSKFSYMVNGREVTLNKPGIETKTGDVYINNLFILENYVRAKMSMGILHNFHKIKPTYSSVVVVDLRDEDTTNKELDIILQLTQLMMSLKQVGKKLVVLISQQEILSKMDTDKFNKWIKLK